jgi:hypothetical protein
MPHTIRLRGPWEYEPLARGSRDDRELPPGGTMAMPGDWGAVLGAAFRGQVRFTRRFAQPTGLDASSRIWLVIEEVDWQAVVALNGQSLGEVRFSGAPAEADVVPCPARFDITTLLLPRNELTIDVLLPEVAAGAPPLARPGREGQPGGLIGLVSLEIESP